MKTSAKGILLIHEFEGFRSSAYRDPVGIWTIGYGFTKGVRAGDTITRQEADKRLQDELFAYEAGVIKATEGKCTQDQFDALVSFAWNVGVAGMSGSSVIKAHNRGDYEEAALKFHLWNKAGGKVLTGLTRRRVAESEVYLTGRPTEIDQWDSKLSLLEFSLQLPPSPQPGSEASGSESPTSEPSKWGEMLRGLFAQIKRLLTRK